MAAIAIECFGRSFIPTCHSSFLLKLTLKKPNDTALVDSLEL